MSNISQDSNIPKDIASILDRLISEAESSSASSKENDNRESSESQPNADNASDSKKGEDLSSASQNTVSALSSLLGGKNISDVLSNPMVQTLMSNPQLLSGLIGGLSGMSQGSQPTATLPSSAQLPTNGISLERHVALLCALKPYVNPNRCEAIDYIIKISEISQLLKKMN